MKVMSDPVQKPTSSDAPGGTDVHNPSLYLNRELSWLQFNHRVLEQARNPDVPLLERVKFLAISGTNVDEFFMVRVAGLQQQVANKIDERGPDGLGPVAQLAEISRRAHELSSMQYQVLRDELFPALEQA